MNPALEEWQARLETHFAELHGQRGDRPVFALEHGLTSQEVETLCRTLRAHARSSAPSYLYRLVWVVYAAEIGYRFAGDEYWQTFAAETPGWKVWGNRDSIRRYFESFAKTYGGAQPHGPWATQFCIICWPITHAILPRDLQRQLAEVLYDLRYSFSAELFASTTVLGEAIAAQSWNASARFRIFVEEPELVGQIAAALLFEGAQTSESLIHPIALQRIGADLDQEARSREWLRVAKRCALERVRVKGLAVPRRTVVATSVQPRSPRDEVTSLGLEPRVMLRPRSLGTTTWDVYLEFPDFSPLLRRFSGSRETLANSRCTVAGAAGSPRARGWLLHGAQLVQLRRWPASDEVLVQFERDDPQLRMLLRTSCLLRPGDRRLFRVEADGVAYECRSTRVRTSTKYVLVSTNGALKTSSKSSSVSVECEGTQGVSFETPDAFSREWELALGELGLRSGRKLEVWPAGLGACTWDGEGHGEWLVSERAYLGVRADHALSALRVSLPSTGNQTLELTGLGAGETVWMELPPLKVGLHPVVFASQTNSDSAWDTLGDLDVVVRVRESRPWASSAGAGSPVSVEVDPPAPTLEQLWDGLAAIRIDGPSGRQLRCEITLKGRGGEVLSTGVVGQVGLPVVPEHFRRLLGTYIERTQHAQDAYEEAKSGEFQFSSDELGLYTLKCERGFTPVRWSVRRNGNTLQARLIDDSGDAEGAVTFAHCATPCVEEVLLRADERAIPTGGGLLVARWRDQCIATLVSPVISGTSLKELSCQPFIPSATPLGSGQMSLISLAGLWGNARLAGGYLANLRQRQVLEAIEQLIVRSICGWAWVRAEADVKMGRAQLSDLGAAIGCVGSRTLAVRVQAAAEAILSAPCHERPSLFHAALRGSVASGGVDLPWLGELALRLASSARVVQSWSGPRLSEGRNLVERFGEVARAARFLVLTGDQRAPQATTGRELHADWGWE